MTVELWYGSWPEHHGEQEALVSTYNYLRAQEELFVMLSDFHVGQREVDLVILKEKGIFLAELKYCSAKIVGQEEGPWQAFPSGKEPFKLFPERSNPYKQVRRYYWHFRKWCQGHSDEISAGIVRSNPVDYNAMKSFVVISPDLHPDNEIDIGRGPVQVIGFPDFLTTILMRSSPKFNLSPQEMCRIPHLLNLTQWHDLPPETERLSADWQPPSFALLVARGHDSSVPLFDLDSLGKDLIAVGRDADNDLVLTPLAVSRHHAEIRKIVNRYVVRDLHSDNGTFVSYGGDPAQERQLAPGAENALKNGSLVRFGPASYTLLLNA